MSSARYSLESNGVLDVDETAFSVQLDTRRTRPLWADVWVGSLQHGGPIELDAEQLDALIEALQLARSYVAAPKTTLLSESIVEDVERGDLSERDALEILGYEGDG